MRGLALVVAAAAALDVVGLLAGAALVADRRRPALEAPVPVAVSSSVFAHDSPTDGGICHGDL
jgi:hypothetical protein